MNLNDDEFGKMESAIWETVSSIKRLDDIKTDVNKEFEEAMSGLKILQAQLLRSTGFTQTQGFFE